MPSPDEQQKVLLGELLLGGEKTFDNAESLYQEAQLLHKSGHLSRALALHQISLEECAKIEMLGACATRILMGSHSVDFSKVWKSLSSHSQKNRTNAYFLDRSAEEDRAMRSGDVKAARAAFSKMQGEFHLTSNSAKNASLYVDFKDGKFVSPKERITLQAVDDIRAQNEKYLGISSSNLRLLRRVAAEPAAISPELKFFEKRLEQLADERPNDPEGVLYQLLAELRERVEPWFCGTSVEKKK